jgi:hypothetical protein
MHLECMILSQSDFLQFTLQHICYVKQASGALTFNLLAMPLASFEVPNFQATN